MCANHLPRIHRAFQFTPLREGRLHSQRKAITGCAFQFTPLREGRRAIPPEGTAIYCISIHAPPRGATSYRRIRGRRSFHFNSRPSARGDRKLFAALKVTAEFQFTPLREGRRVLLGGGVEENISIHAPPRGATVVVSLIVQPSLFQFTPLREGRRTPLRGARSSLGISIHAPPRGATPTLWRRRTLLMYFNSRPSARGDTWRTICLLEHRHFNSRPSARGDRKERA